MRKALNVVVVGVLLLILSACESSLVTEIDLSKSGEITGEVTLTFTGEASETVKENTKVQAQIVEVMATKIGSVPTIDKSSDRIIFVSKIEKKNSVSIEEFTGVIVSSSKRVGDEITVAIKTVFPIQVTNAIEVAVANEPDKEALKAAIFESTKIGILITMPGKITNVSSKIPYERLGKKSVEFSQSLNQYVSTEVEVESKIDTKIFKYSAVTLVLLFVFMILYRKLKK
jgi:hypothetical protein